MPPKAPIVAAGGALDPSPPPPPGSIGGGSAIDNMSVGDFCSFHTLLEGPWRTSMGSWRWVPPARLD